MTSLSDQEKELLWEQYHRHSMGIPMVCPDCGDPQASECPCSKKEFFESLSTDDITKFREQLKTTCSKCDLNLVACDCEYQEAVREFEKSLTGE